jgi:hypothetical protein
MNEAISIGEVRVRGNKATWSTFDCWEMLEFEVNLPASLHISKDPTGPSGVGWREYHNAYDADENGRLIRGEAVFKSPEGKDISVPVFAAKDPGKEITTAGAGEWKWLVRFQPHLAGKWQVQVTFKVRHPNRVDANDSEQVEADGARFYQHEAKSAVRGFTVAVSKLPGTLMPPTQNGDNLNYFYRTTDAGGRYERRPFFLHGLCRPWAVDIKKWDSYLDRKEDLFKAMKDARCNVLVQWLAPWETQIVHQSAVESAPRGWEGGPMEPLGGWKADRQLTGADAELGYKRYDQGRSRRLDAIFQMAQEAGVLIFLVVMPHPLLRPNQHDWDTARWHAPPPPPKPHPKRRCDDASAVTASQYNGFALFDQQSRQAGVGLSIEAFFKAKPGEVTLAAKKTRTADEVKQEKLWKHYANFWRYLIARWGAHPALGAWTIVDEMEGLGLDSKWWWKNDAKETKAWHDNVLRLLRGKQTWQSGADKAPYTSDYLNHLITSSATSYKWPTSYGKNLSTIEGVSDAVANTQEEKDHGNWVGGSEPQDFFSHHVYPTTPVPASQKPLFLRSNKDEKPAEAEWYNSNAQWREGDKADRDPLVKVEAERWLWDALCQRLSAWSRCFGEAPRLPRLVTEYGAVERDCPDEEWDRGREYYRRVPAYTHFANWAGLSLGLAGIPFKWNDREFGEMAPRSGKGKNAEGKVTESPIWNKDKYPPDSYAEIKVLQKFLEKIDLQKLVASATGYVEDMEGNNEPFGVFARTSKGSDYFIAWLYDRTFRSKGRSQADNKLALQVLVEGAFDYTFYDTWSGEPLKSKAGRGCVTTDKKGYVRIPLPDLPERPGKNTLAPQADGNDIAVILTKRSSPCPEPGKRAEAGEIDQTPDLAVPEVKGISDRIA